MAPYVKRGAEHQSIVTLTDESCCRACLVAYACCGGERKGFAYSHIWKRATTDRGVAWCDRRGLRLQFDPQLHIVGRTVAQRAYAFWLTSKLVTCTTNAKAAPLCACLDAVNQRLLWIRCSGAAWPCAPGLPMCRERATFRKPSLEVILAT